MPPPSRPLWPFAILAGALIGGALHLARPRPAPPPAPPVLDGEALAKQHCAACHLFPAPDIHTRRDWVAVLNFMGLYLGHDDARMRVDYPPDELANIVDMHRVPSAPVVTRAQWAAIREFYRSRAPASREAVDSAPLPPLPGFDVVVADDKPQIPFTSVVTVLPDGRILAGDAVRRTLLTIAPDGKVKSTRALPGVPASIHPDGDGLLVSLIGNFEPSNARHASIVRMGKEPEVLVENLLRTPDAHLADLDGDGTAELITAQFGHHQGRLAVHVKEGTAWRERVILDQPGALQLEVKDFTHDGKPDLLVMFAQAWESVHLFVNLGGLRFEDSTLLRMHPAFGSSSFVTADFNGDGEWDLVQVNGDNGDLPIPPLRPYHGIRIHLNNGDNTFREAFFHAMPGAYRAVPADLDGDGDLDLAAVAFFPDFSSSSPIGFTALINDGGLRFTAYGLPRDVTGRWISIASGDVDGDGDVDLVLAGACPQVGIEDKTVWQRLAQEGRSVVILRNRLKARR